MKKLLTLLLVLAFVFTMVSCTESQDASEVNNDNESTQVTDGTEHIKAVMIGGMPGGPAWGPAAEGFMLACEELGWEGTYLAPQTPANETEIAELMLTSVTQGAKVVFALMYDNDIMAPVVEECKEKDVILISAQASVDGIDAWIGADSDDTGKMFAQAVDELTLKDAHIYSVSMTTNLSSATQKLNDGYIQSLTERRSEEDITIFDTLECQSDTQKAYTNFSAFKLATPECNVFIAQNSYACLGVAQYIKEYGLEDEICAIGIDDSADILQAVKDGYLDGTVSQNFYNIGYGGAYLAKKVLDGEEYEFANSSNPQLVTADMVEEWAAKLGYTLK